MGKCGRFFFKIIIRLWNIIIFVFYLSRSLSLSLSLYLYLSLSLSFYLYLPFSPPPIITKWRYHIIPISRMPSHGCMIVKMENASLSLKSDSLSLSFCLPLCLSLSACMSVCLSLFLSLSLSLSLFGPLYLFPSLYHCLITNSFNINWRLPSLDVRLSRWRVHPYQSDLWRTRAVSKCTRWKQRTVYTWVNVLS